MAADLLDRDREKMIALGWEFDPAYSYVSTLTVDGKFTHITVYPVNGAWMMYTIQGDEVIETTRECLPLGIYLHLGSVLPEEQFNCLQWSRTKPDRWMQLRSRSLTDPWIENPETADKQERESCVYFIACQTTPFIKIGYADRPKERLSVLQIGCPLKLELIGTIPGNEETESSIHQHFDFLRIRGEWFQSSPALLDFINGSIRLGKPAQLTKYKDDTI